MPSWPKGTRITGFVFPLIRIASPCSSSQ
jgi:hypothetical protein